jgi:hypothetical protein
LIFSLKQFPLETESSLLISTGISVQALYGQAKKQLLGEKMQRNEAISYLKALLGSDIDISPDSVSIEKQQASKTVKIRIKISNYDRQHIEETAKKRALAIKEENDSIVIYSQ